jgi:hypothetical protein
MHTSNSDCPSIVLAKDIEIAVILMVSFYGMPHAGQLTVEEIPVRLEGVEMESFLRFDG